MRWFRDCQNCENAIVKKEYEMHRQMALKNGKLKYEVERLTNNWNELEEWVKKQIEEKKYGNDFERWGAYSTMLDKMKEIKEGNND